MKLAATASIGAIVVCSSTAHAGIPVINDEATFLAMLSDPVYTESYENYAPDSLMGARTISLDRFDVSYNGTSDFGVSDLVNIPAGVSPIDGDQHLQAVYGDFQVVTVSFLFDSSVTAFGTYISDIEVTSLSVSVGLTNGQTFDSQISANGNGGVTYFGIEPIVEDIEFVSFTMISFSGLDGAFFDRTSITIPAPASAAALSALALLQTRRRR